MKLTQQSKQPQAKNNRKVQLDPDRFTELLLSSLKNVIISKNKVVDLTSKTYKAENISFDKDALKVLSRLIKSLILKLNFNHLKALTTDKRLNIYFNEWDLDMSFLEDSNISNSLHYLKMNAENLDVQIGIYNENIFNIRIKLG